MLTTDIDKELRNAKRRVARARNFPHNTNPSARHLEIMARHLASGEVYQMMVDEPKICALEIYNVLELLYKKTNSDQEDVCN